jgi:hypothetical protein
MRYMLNGIHTKFKSERRLRLDDFLNSDVFYRLHRVYLLMARVVLMGVRGSVKPRDPPACRGATLPSLPSRSAD